MKRIISLILGLWASLACAQSAPISGIALSQFGQPVPFAQIRVCNVTSTGTPCSPVSTIYQDYGLSVPIANPTTADQFGNYTFYVGAASPNLYIVQTAAGGGQTFSYVQSGPSSGGGGGGSVSSVGLSMPGIFSVAGSPITTAGVIGVTLAQEPINTAFLGPPSGSPGTPTFRSIAAADLPSAVTFVTGPITTGHCAQFAGLNQVADAGIGCSTTGVTAINGITGSFSFTGSVTCTGTSCNFTGGGGGSGGVGPGVVNQLSYYDTTSTVHGDGFLTDTAPTNGTSGLLSYTGPGGANFSTSNGGGYTLSTTNQFSTAASRDSQINILASTLQDQTASAVNPGLITIQSTDTSGMANSANILINADEVLGTGSASLGNEGNVSISASGGGTGQSTGNVSITTNANEQVTSGNISLTANGGTSTGFGGNIALVTNSGTPGLQSGAISLNASNFGAPLLISASNLSLDSIGNAVFSGNVISSNFLRSAILTNGNCLTADFLGNIVSTTSPCATGGGGGITGSGTGGYVALFSGSGTSTTIGISHLDDGLTTAGRLTSTEPINIADGTGAGGALIGTFGSSPTPSGTVDTLWSDSSGRWKMNNANTGAFIINGIASAGTANDCVKLAANGIDLADAGAVCAGSNTFTSVLFTGATSGTVTVQAQAVAGTPTITWPTTSGQVALTTAESFAFNATPTFTPGDSMSRMTTLTGNVTTFTMGATASGTPHVLCWQQGSGSFTVTPPANVHGFTPIGNTSTKWNCQQFMYNAADAIWLATSNGVLNQ